MDEFAKMLYKVGGQEMIGGVGYEYMIVENQEEQDEAEAEGWHTTTDAAFAASKPKAKPAPVDDAEPSRAELEAKAAELGLKFDGRTSDAKLSAMIDDALKA